MPNVVKIQTGYEAQPLSAYLHQAAPLVAPVFDFPKINKDLIQTGFFNYFDFALQFASAGPEEKEIRAKLARLGIGAAEGHAAFHPSARRGTWKPPGIQMVK